jgi:drug/metabolite transporter (DMT)-like permease
MTQPQSASAARRADPQVLAAFAFIVLFLGVNFVAVRFSNRELPPFWGGALRFLIATALLLAVASFRRLPMPQGRGLVGALLFGTLAFGVNFALLYWALVAVPAATASVTFSTIPLLTLLIAVAIGQERFRWQGLIGALIALAGTALAFQQQLELAIPFLPLLAVLGAAFCAALSGIVVRGFPRSHPISTNAVGMAAGASILLVASFVAGEPHHLPLLPATWVALAWLVVSSTVAFVLMVWVLGRWTASATSYSAVISPLVTVVAAALLAGEAITPLFAVGSLLVLAGVYFGAIASARPPTPSPSR